MTKNYAYYKNQLILDQDIKISPNDRGFKFGDGVFETIKIFNSKTIWWERHLKRMNAGLNSLKITTDIGKILAQSNDLIAKNNIENGLLRISITRGESSKGYLPTSECSANILIQTIPAREVEYSPKDLLISSYNKIPDTCLPSHAKSIANGLNSSLARLEANENNFFEALMLTTNGKIAECSSGNIFWYKKGTIYTPKNNLIKGVLREFLLENSEIPIIEGDYNIEHLKDAEEVFISNISWIVLPIKSINPVGFCYESSKICNMLKDRVSNYLHNY